MLKIKCPCCGESDRENIIIIEEVEKLRYDRCGKLFDLDELHTPTLPGGYGVPPEESVGGWGA